MDGIEVSQEMGGCVQEVGCASAGFEGGKRKLLKELIHAGGYVLGIAEHVSALRRAHSPVFPGPGIDVLKRMMVDASIVGGSEAPVRKGLLRSQCRHFELEIVQGLCIPEASPVLEDGCAFVAIGVVEYVVSAQVY
jgi:hypothetical protein